MTGLSEHLNAEAGTPRLQSELNVTPFIDVMLVLLVIFMISAPLMIVGVPLKLPKTVAPPMSQPRKPAVVSMDKDGHLFFAGEELTAERLADRLSALIKNVPDPVVYVRADRRLDYGRVLDLLGQVAAAGVAKVSLVAEGRAKSSGASKP